MKERHIVDRLSAAHIFVFFAVLTGLILVAIIPPMAGGNERLNFQRSVTIAAGQYTVGPVLMPGGIADILQLNRSTFPEGRKPPYSYSRAEFEETAAIRLQPGRPAVVKPNPIAVLHPLSYLPQIPLLALGLELGLSPLVLFYLGRFAGLAAGVALTAAAIRTIPVHKTGLAAIALLPPILFSRSTLDADQFTNGLAFLFIALVCSAVSGEGPLEKRLIGLLTAMAFILAQCKSAYLLLPFFCLAMPRSRFGSLRAKLTTCALIIAPGVLASVGWMVVLKQTYFHEIRYRTWSGIVVPDEQMKLILSHPIMFGKVVVGTVFGSSFLPRTIIEFFGAFGPPVTLPLPYYPALAVLLVGSISAQTPAGHVALQRVETRLLAVGIAFATALIILTLLYLQWTRLGGARIDGFNGRYYFPLAPLLLLLVPSRARPLLDIPASFWLIGIGLVSAGGTCWLTWVTYVQ